MRRLLLVPFFVLASAGCAGAATELCGAEPRMVVALHQPAADTSTVFPDTAYGYVLSGEAPRTVTGHLDIYTGSQAGYQIPFQDVRLERTEHQFYRPDGAPYLKYVDYESAPLYFQLPKAQAVHDVWVDDSGFEGHPHQGCEISPFDLEYEQHSFFSASKQSGGLTAADVRKGAPTVLPAVLPREMPGSDTCGRHFMPSRVTQPFYVEYPESMRTSYEGPVDILTKVLVDENGAVIDAWLFGGSPFSAFNNAGLRAAEKSTYAPAEFLCKKVPYLNVFLNKFDM